MPVNKSNDFDKAKTRALKILSYRDHSGGELLQKLSKHFDEKTSEKALAWVREIGYQNDKKYAEKLAAVLIESKHYGVRRARWEMKQKGLSEDIIETALEAYNNDEIVGIITGIIERKYADFLDDRPGVKKTVDALMRRGYDYSDIKTAVSRVKEDMEFEYNE
ncbi:MAG: recombination regulator RecX [Oscillospiraceae bacterium]|nr:recombination regulator RecX [Oscillospiraceae bacterium]